MLRTKDQILATQSNNNRIAVIIQLKIKTVAIILNRIKVVATAQSKVRIIAIVQRRIKAIILQLKIRAIVRVVLCNSKQQTPIIRTRIKLVLPEAQTRIRPTYLKTQAQLVQKIALVRAQSHKIMLLQTLVIVSLLNSNLEPILALIPRMMTQKNILARAIQ